MASRKSKRYGQGGNNHKRTPNLLRQNGKAFKQHPKAFDLGTRRLVTADQKDKGLTALFI